VMTPRSNSSFCQYSGTRFYSTIAWLLPLLLGGMAAEVRAQFNFTTNNGTLTITQYTGPGGDVIIPDMLGGLPVSAIGSQAFFQLPNLTSVMMSALGSVPENHRF
jgi:hypothetical protein